MTRYMLRASAIGVALLCLLVVAAKAQQPGPGPIPPQDSPGCGGVNPCPKSQGGTSAATAQDARYSLGPNNACNPVTDFGADPTGISDSAAAINSCAAIIKNGQSVDIYLPEGMYYVTNSLNVGLGQCLYGDGRGNTTITVDQSFNVSATGVIVLTGREQLGPCVHDLAMSFAQPSDQAVRANFANLGTCTSGTGGTGCKYPPAIFSSSANRFRLYNLLIQRAWDGIGTNSGDQIGGSWIQNIEMSALDVGLAFDSGADFCHIDNFHFWPFGINSGSALFTGVYEDGNTFAAKMGRCDGIVVKGWTPFQARTQLTANFTFGQFSAVSLDGNNSTFEVIGTSGTGVQVDNVRATGHATGSNSNAQIQMSNGRLTVTNADLSTSVVSNIGHTGGTFDLTGAIITSPTVSVPMIAVSGGKFHASSVVMNPQGGPWTVAPITVTGSATIELNSAEFPVTAGDVGALTIATDNTSNFVQGNNFNGWGFMSPGPLGQYWPNGGIPSTWLFTGGPIATLGAVTGGSGYVAGTYTSVPLTGGTGTRALATVVVSGGGAVSTVTLTNNGAPIIATGATGYLTTDTLSASNANLGGSGSGFSIPVATLGNYSWTKWGGIPSFRFTGCGGGGGGGGGALELTLVAASGGAGGGGAGCFDNTFAASSLSISPYSFGIGMGGAGGAGATSSTAAGSPGASTATNAFATQVVALLYACPGSPGGGGQLAATASIGGNGGSVRPANCASSAGVGGTGATGSSPNVFQTGSGGGGGLATGASVTGSGNLLSCPSGASGGGLTSASASNNGGNGAFSSFLSNYNPTVPAGGTSGTINGGGGVAPFGFAAAPGSSGAGGYGNLTAAGNGGAGINCSGGGGGGTSENGGTAGNGGAGGNGWLRIIGG